jgi:hypothetical protein
MNNQVFARWRPAVVATVALAALASAPHIGMVVVRAEDSARAIVEEAEKRIEVKSQRYEGILQTFEGSGKMSEKRWTYQRIGAHGRSKSVIRFTAPAEVKGVALLIFNQPDRASDQWMWTPAVDRERRIAAQDRSTRFFGTDFSFEDLEERDVNEYDYTMLGEEAIDGAACWKVRWVPKQSKSSQYSQAVVWIRKDNYAYARIDSSVKDQIVRRLTYSDIRNVQGIWTSHDLTMADLRRGSRTRLVLDKVQYNLPLKDDEFTLEALRR